MSGKQIPKKGLDGVYENIHPDVCIFSDEILEKLFKKNFEGPTS